MRLGRHAASAVAAAGLCLEHCGTTPGTTLRVAHEADVLSLDPSAVAETATQSVLSNMYESLAAFDKDMRLHPALAKGWHAVDDRTWIVELRSGVRFHDGSPLAPADVKAALDRARSGDSGIKGALVGLDEVEVSGPSTLRLRTLRADPLLLNGLADVLIGKGFSAEPGHPVGTGPYRFVRWNPGSFLEMEAFDGYWGGRPAVSRVQFVPVPTGEAGLLALREKRVDVLRWVAETVVSQARAIPGYRVTARTGLVSYYLWLDSASRLAGAPNPLADRRVRQAVSMAIDRKEVVARLGGIGTPANQFVQPGVFGHLADLPPLPFDPARARELLREAGYARGFEITLVHRAQTPSIVASQAVRDMLGQAGVRVRLDTADWPAMLDAWAHGRIPFFLAAWRSDSGDAQRFLRDCFQTRDASGNTGSFNPGFSDPELDHMIVENAQMFDNAKRLDQYARLMRLAMERMPIVPLYHRANLYAVSEEVAWEPRLDGNLRAAEMSFR